MREKLNSSPIAQVGLVVVLLLAGAVLFLSKSGGEEEEAASGPTVASVNGVTAEGDTAGEAVEGAIASLEAGAAEASATEIPSSVPAPPPPAEFTAAYESGKTVVLLVVHDGGIDDALTAAASARLATVPDVALFRVSAERLARYASITVGLNVNRVPALVVLRPQQLSGGIPQASVDYGFQTPQSLVQAVLDASYKGPEETYHPD